MEKKKASVQMRIRSEKVTLFNNCINKWKVYAIYRNDVYSRQVGIYRAALLSYRIL